jgi:HEAT repeat protein
MQRSKTDGAEVLLGLLATAETIRERKAYMAALREMPEGVAQVIHMLHHHQWFVVRNVAELMGESRIEESVPELGLLLTHQEPRVRRAAVVAMAKIGSATTVEPLRRALKEGTPEMRALIAGSIGGPEAKALAMPLVALAVAEENLDVLREYYRALGRIGTPEAVQALAKACEPGGRLVGRRPTAPRLAAVEGLRLATAPASAAALEKLTEDADKQVREAARRALGR